MKRFLAIAVAAIFAGVPAEAAYQYLYYNRSFPGTPIRAQFDLSALPNKTVTFFVNDNGPSIYHPNDSFGSVLAEIKQAIAAWNSVGGSALRVAFGGLETPNQPENSPGADVIFTDLPPGLLGMASPNLQAVPVLSSGPSGQFVAIRRSTVMLTNNTSELPGPSYLEGFFTTAVHEVGHALGLQHTWTSSAMSQDNNFRNTSRARPLDADDAASLLTLYGAAGWASNYGSISGTVRYTNGQPVPLASVVAIPPNGPAVSALSNPDGSYTINGVPPNSYYLYAHPLPPDAISNGTGLLLPSDLNGKSFSVGGPFQTVFYPGNLNPQVSIQITAGQNVSAQNFSVQPKNSVPMYDAWTYSYLGPNQTPVSPAYVNTSSGQIQIVAQDNTSAPTPIPQSVTILGGGFGTAVVGGSSTAASIVPYGSPVALALNFFVPLFAGMGPRHLLFNFGNDIFVLPNGLNLTQKDPPGVTSVNANFDGTVNVSGTNFGPDSRVFFDGLPAAGVFNGNSMTVTPPPGTNGQVSTVSVYNSDGQNSMFLQSQSPPTYTYPAAGTPMISSIPQVLTAGFSPVGFSSLVDIVGLNTNFVSGQTSVGFGTSDISVSNTWVLSPTHVIANVVVAPNAMLGASEVSVISGFQVASQPYGFQVQQWNPALPLIALPVVSATGGPVYPGAFASIYGLNLAPAGGSAQITLNGAPMAVQYSSSYQVNFQIPAGYSIGPAILKLSNGAGSASVVVEIDNPPPVIVGIADLSSGAALDLNHAAAAGDALSIQLTGLDPSILSNLSRVQVTVAGVSMPVFQVMQGQNGQFQLQFSLNQSFGGAPVPVVVLADGSPSAAYLITAR